MFGNFSEIAIVNVQSHSKSIFKFDGMKIHRIRGESPSNSHGKSVLRKALQVLMTPSGKSREERRAIIRDTPGVDHCRIIVLSTTGVYFELYLHLEEKYSYYLMKHDGYEIKKYLSDDYEVLLDIAGFHFLKSEKYSLNVYVTKTSLPFTHFRPRLNYQILDSASGLKDYDLLMRDINENLSCIKDELVIANNHKSMYQSQLEFMGEIDLESSYIHETVLERYIKRFEPIELVNISLPELVTSSEQLGLLTHLDPKPILLLKPQLYSFSKIDNQLGSLLTSEKELKELKVEVPVSKELTALINSIPQLEMTKNNIGYLVNDLETIKDIKLTSNPNRVKIHVNESKKLHRLHTHLGLLVDTSSSLSDKEVKEDSALNLMRALKPEVANLSALVPSLESLEDNMSEYIETRHKVKEMSRVKEVTKLMIPAKILRSLELDGLISGREREDELDKKIKVIKLEIDKIKSKLPICETCGQVVYVGKEDSHTDAQ